MLSSTFAAVWSKYWFTPGDAYGSRTRPSAM
jgi:hypothetical protein